MTFTAIADRSWLARRMSALAIGGRRARVRNELYAHFGLDENHMVYAGIALGWPDRQEPANKIYAERAPLSEVVEFRL